jgi:hypothetical protein
MDDIDKARILNSINNSNSDRLQKIVDRKTNEKKQTPSTFYAGHNDDGRALVRTVDGAIAPLNLIGNVQPSMGGRGRSAGGGFDPGTNIIVSQAAYRPTVRPQDCFLPGVLIYQHIIISYRPNSYYGSFDGAIYYKDKIIWFPSNGAPVTLYELISDGNGRSGFSAYESFANSTYFWGGANGRGEVCFKYTKFPVAGDFYDIWDLSDSTAVFRKTISSFPSNGRYLGGSAEVGPSLGAGSEYLLRESPRTTYGFSVAGGKLSIGGTDYPVKEKLANGSFTEGFITPAFNVYSLNMATMVKKIAIRYGLNFNTSGTTFAADEFCWSINGKVAALVNEQIFTLEGANYVTEPFISSVISPTTILPRPPKLTVSGLGNFNQPLALPTPPFAANEHYWIESNVSVDAINTSEGLAVDIRLIGSYVNMSKNCLIKNGTTLGKTPIGRKFVFNDPNIPI